jgi:hypothetical protein
MRSTYHGESGHWLTTALTVVAVLLLAAVTLTDVWRLADRLRPQVGDIITFVPANPVKTAEQTSISVAAAGNLPAIPCTLDPDVLRASGGSLVIEARQLEPDVSYRVHWAGKRTSDSRTDCGRSAELLLRLEDVAVLRIAASGP